MILTVFANKIVSRPLSKVKISNDSENWPVVWFGSRLKTIYSHC